MSDSVRPHRWQPTRLPHPWDSPGKNTGVGCHFLLQCMKVKSEREVTQSCPTLRDAMDCNLPGSSIHGIFQARVLEWVARISKIRMVSQRCSKPDGNSIIIPPTGNLKQRRFPCCQSKGAGNCLLRDGAALTLTTTALPILGTLSSAECFHSLGLAVCSSLRNETS